MTSPAVRPRLSGHPWCPFARLYACELPVTAGGAFIPAEVLTQQDGGAAPRVDVEGKLVDDRLHDEDAAPVLGVAGGVLLGGVVGGDPQVPPAIAEKVQQVLKGT